LLQRGEQGGEEICVGTYDKRKIYSVLDGRSAEGMVICGTKLEAKPEGKSRKSHPSKGKILMFLKGSRDGGEIGHVG